MRPAAERRAIIAEDVVLIISDNPRLSNPTDQLSIVLVVVLIVNFQLDLELKIVLSFWYLISTPCILKRIDIDIIVH